MNKYNLLILFFVILILVLPSCAPADESATKGNFAIAVDESFTPLLGLEKEAFSYSYPKIKIDLVSTSEGKSIGLLLEDSVRMIVISRELDTTEKQILGRSKIKYRSTKIAIDGVALIVNKDNPDSLITNGTLKNIFTGKIKIWNDLNSSGMRDSIIVVFDKGNSSNLSFLNTKLGLSKEEIKIFAAKSNVKVIDYVKNHKGALGIIGLGWISDKDSPLSMELKNNIKLMWVAGDSSEDTLEYYLPTQSDLAKKTYPFIREMICISREPGTGPATGFMNYIKSDIGQRIVLKSGLLPTIMPTRRIKIK